jgi:hypothetical protein
MGTSSLAAVALTGAACSSAVAIAEGTGGTGASGGAGGTGGAGGAGASGGAGGATTTGGAGGQGGGSACDAGSWQPTTQACLPAQGEGCAAIDAPGLGSLLAAQLGLCDAMTDYFACCNKPALVGVLCASGAGAGCCYEAWIDPQLSCASGRPFVVDGRARTAQVRAGAGWSAPAAPAVAALDPVTRAALAASWTREAGFEHASVASFARLALELLAVGAPAELVRDAQRAMGDEIHHAELGFALASAYAGAPVGPGAMAMEGALARTSLAGVAAAAVREGCIGETVAALLVEEARDRAEDPAVRAALTVIAADEADHAAMAWRLVAWAHRAGDAAVREAIAAAFAAPAGAAEEAVPVGVDPQVYRAHGRPLPEDVRAVVEGALAEVIRPSAAALMGSAAVA